MQFLVYDPHFDPEKGAPPTPELMEEMGKFIAEAIQANALVATGSHAGNRVILAKPQTFMNLSGQAVSALVRFYKLPLTDLMVAHDHLDLPFGAIRIRPDGGAGGQRGMDSIIERLGTQEFPRIRLGIGRPPGQMDPAAYVLQEFSNSDRIFLSQTLDKAADALFLWMEEGLDAAMTRFNGREPDNE